MKRSLAMLVVLLSFAAVSARGADSTKINGWISDSMCGAKHAGTGAACAKKCVEGGSDPVFVDEAKKAVWKIDNPDQAKRFAGSHVTISAVANAGTKTVHIESIEEAK